MNFIERQNHKLGSIVKTYIAKDENTKRWEGLHNKFAGKRVFLIGNGPSLNKTPLYQLKDEYTLCLNRFYMLRERLSWDPNFYMCIDPLVVPDIHKEINEYIQHVDYSFFQEIHNNHISKKAGNVYWMTEINPVKFRYKLPLISRGSQTVAIAALQVLMYLGFTDIYLIGIDQNYTLHTTAKEINGRRIESQKDDDPNHFDPRYFGSGRKYHQPDKWCTDRMMEGFIRAKKNADESGINIYNAGVGGMLEVYPRVDLEDLLDFSEKEKLSLLSLCINKGIDLAKVKEALKNPAIILQDLEDPANMEKEIFTLPLSQSEKYIQKIIFTHIPFGPINGKHLFIKRDVREAVVKKYLS